MPNLIEETRPRCVLHIAPEPILKTLLTNREFSYETADLFLGDVDHTGVDLQALPFRDGAYELIVCNHVLEHVPDDQRAIDELSRVTSKCGRLLLTVPGDFSRRDTTRFTGKLDNGHYRHYGLDLVDALRARFERVEVHDLHKFDRDGEGLSRAIRSGDLAFECGHS